MHRIGLLPLLFALSAGAAPVAHQATIANVHTLPATLFLTLAAGLFGLGALYFLRRIKRTPGAAVSRLAALAIAVTAAGPAHAAYHFGNQKPANLPYLAARLSSYTWAEGVRTPEIFWAKTYVYPYSMTIDWGDGTPLASSFYNYDNQATFPNYQFIKNSAYIPNLVQCYAGPFDCQITGRHTYFCPAGSLPTCQFTMQIAISYAAFAGQSQPAPVAQVAIPITIVRSNPSATFNIFSAGDSIASGEGNPLYHSAYCNVSFPFLTYACDGTLGTGISATWERIFDQGSLTPSLSTWHGNENEAHRSVYAGPNIAAQMLGYNFLNARLPLRVNFYTRAWSGATIDKPATRTISSQLYDAGRSNNFIEPTFGGVGKYDVVTLTAGANNIPLSELVTKCGGAACEHIAWGDGKSIGKHVQDELDHLNHVQPNPFDSRLPGLGGYQLLDYEIRHNGAINKARVFISAYFDFEESLRCTSVTAADSRAYVTNVVRLVNLAASNAATLYGWTFVPVSFTGHGMCEAAGVKWIANFKDSIDGQGDPAGYLHPNIAGHQEYANRYYNAILPLALGKAHCALPQATNLQLTLGAFRRNFASGPGQWTQQYTIRNTGSAVSGPVVILFKDILKASGTVVSSATSCPDPNSDPLKSPAAYFVAPLFSGTLAPNASVTGVLTFRSQNAIRYTPALLNAGY